MYPIIFKMRPLKGRRKVECRLYATKRDMLKAIRKDTIGGIENAVLACTVWAVRNRTDKEVKAYVYLCKTHLCPGIVAHELYHVAEEFVKKTMPAEKREEAVAQLLGELVEAFHGAMPL